MLKKYNAKKNGKSCFPYEMAIITWLKRITKSEIEQMFLIQLVERNINEEISIKNKKVCKDLEQIGYILIN